MGYSGGPVNADRSVEKIAAEDIRFHASDISRPDENNFFNNLKDQRRREKAEQKRIRAEAKRISKEARSKKDVSGASNEVAAQEEKLKREQNKIESEYRRARIRSFLGRRAKHWYIYVSVIVVVAVAVCGVVFVPRIIQEINSENDKKYLAENMTPILKLFKEIAGKELSKNDINGYVAKYNGELISEYYPQAAAIYPKNSYSEVIKMLPKFDGSGLYHLFTYKVLNGESGVTISMGQTGYIYANGEKQESYSEVGAAVDAFVLDTRRHDEE